jgi:Carboxypeptidase regulatory-like domain
VKRWVVILALVIGCGIGAWMLGHRQAATIDPVATPSAAMHIQDAEPTPEPEQSPGARAAEAVAAGTASASASATGTFRGRLIDAVTRRPVAQEFEVRLLGARFELPSREEPPVTQTFQSEDGRFAWKHAPAGTWHVRVAAHGYQPFDIANFSIAAGKTSREIVMPLRIGYTVRGRVFDQRSGEGIGEASIWAHRTEDGEQGPYAQTESKPDGTFELDGSPGGDVTLSVGRKDYVHRRLEMVVGADTPPQDIGLSTGGGIAGSVTTAAGAPVEGHVMLSSRNMFYGNEQKAGQFAFEHLPPGQYDLTAITPAGSAKLRIDLGQDERKEGIVVTLAEGRSIRGIVRGLRPEQLAEAHVSLQSKASRDLFFGAKPDEQGKYVLNGVPPGRALISAVTSASGRSHRHVAKTIDVPPDQDLAFDIVFPQGARLSGTVTQEGKPVPRTDVWLMPVDKQHESYRGWTSAEGRYDIEGVALGDYRIQARESTVRNITISGDSVLNIDIPSVQLGGLVIEDGSEVPIVGATVNVRGTEVETSSVDAHKSTDQFGRFKLTGLERGDILFTVFKPGYEMYRERLVYDTPVADKTVRLRKTTGVEVRAHSAAGEPLRSLWVLEVIPGNEQEIGLQIPLNLEGAGFLPSALAGSSLIIYGGGQNPIVIRQWDGHSLDLKF